MTYKYNPFSGELDLVLGPGEGNAATDFATDSGTANPTAGGVITISGGTGISTSGSGSTVTIASTSGAFTWNEETGTSANLAAGNGYIANNAGVVTFTLPASASIGDTFIVTGKGAGGWAIAQNAGQTINIGSSSTTTGAGGSLASTAQFDTVEIVCITANNDFNVIDLVGNITVV